jgi:quinone-modifying oxidoreductase subunit QmoC
MAESYTANPDVGFIKEISALGGQDVKKCFQCATCSVVCPISPDTKPFPRKEMIATSWGLKDRLIGNGDIWLCHNCGDCSSKCPRGAKPGDVLSALRAYTIAEYAPKMLKGVAKAVPDPKKLPMLLALPAIIFIVVGLLTNIVGLSWFKLYNIAGGHWQNDFIANYLVDIIMIPTSMFAIIVFALSLKNFIADIHANAVAEGKTTKEKIEPVEFVRALIRVVPTILKHQKFNECTDNRDRGTSHMMVLFAFIGLFVVTACFFIAEWVFHILGPYSQINPIKWLGNVSGVALLIGSALLIKNRIAKTDQIHTYWDWSLLGLVFGLGLTGMITEMARLGGMMFISNSTYFLHLMLVWSLFAYIPFSKLAHLVYRVVAMTYSEYAERK